MPSPFPGMDPYLEGELWGGFHHDLITAIRHQLIPQLKPRYYPFTQRYFLVDTEELAIAEPRTNPDIAVVQESSQPVVAKSTGTMTAPVEMLLPRPRPRRVPHYRLAIRDLEKRRLVTVIEFLSPTNKKGEGRSQYLFKRNLILASAVHLVEIDLLRQGRRVPMKQALPVGDYFVFVSRANQRPKVEVWPVLLKQPLPQIPIPLKKKDPLVSLDLQQALQTVYDGGSFDSVIDYRKPPDVPLTRRQQAWADQWLRPKANGRRSRA